MENEYKVRIDKTFDGETSLKAFATVTLNNTVTISGIKLMENRDTRFIAMPSRQYQDANGETQYVDVCHMNTKDSYVELLTNAFDAYDKYIQEQNVSNESQVMESENVLSM